MSLAAAVSKVGLDVALRQAGFVYQISRQSMTDSDATKIEKMRLSFSNHPIWEKTANARVTKEKRGEGEVYRIDFLYQAKPRGKSKKIKHGKRYATVHEAEGAMFDVRMSKESKNAKAAILQVLQGNAELEPIPKKVSSVASAGPARKKVKATMKCDHAARTSHRPNRNPNGPGDITAEALANRYGGSTNWVELIQRKRWRIFLTKASRDADIKMLSEAFRCRNEWWKLMPYGEDEEVRIDATDADQAKLMTQAKCVLAALEMYEKHHDDDDDDGTNDKSCTWRQACQDAVAALKEKYNGQTVERWYIQFRYNTEQTRRFPLSKTGKQSNGAICPFSLPRDIDGQDDGDLEVPEGHEYQHEILEFRRWFDDNQKIMSCAKARIWYQDKVKGLSMNDHHFLTRYRIKSLDPLSLYVTKCWMREMGVEYCRTKKNYYVKRHESKKAKGQRAVYIPWSFKNELYEHCWVQLDEQELVDLASKISPWGDGDDATETAATATAAASSTNDNNRVGVCYRSLVSQDALVSWLKNEAERSGIVNEETVWEYHRDQFEELHEIANREPFGGKLSIAFPAGALAALVSGHDESMYAQNNCSLSGYVRNGIMRLMGKGNGLSEMVSAMISAELGWGMRSYLASLTPEELEAARERFNRLHRRGKQYHPLIQDRAEEIVKTINKREYSKEEFTVTINPAIRYLKAGNAQGREGNWNFSHFVVQFEDFRDFMFALFPHPDDETKCKYKLIIEVDQSSNHNTARPDALKAENMNHKYGGDGEKKRVIRESAIPDPIPPGTKYIGPFVPVVPGTTTEHPRRARPGVTVPYFFSPGDPVPFHPGREAPPEQDVPIPGQFYKDKPFTKNELWTAILTNDPTTQMPAANAQDAKLTDLQRMATRADLPLQHRVPKIKKGYVRDGKVPIGMIEYLYRRGFIDPAAEKAPSKEECIEILESLTDFQTELTLLQKVGRDLGLEVIMTPICHCEIAGRAVEYGWGLSKLDYRKINCGDSGKTREYIEKSFESLTIEVVRKLGRLVREYKLAYRTLIKEQEGSDSMKTLALKKIERVKQSIKSKRQLDQYKGMGKELKKARKGGSK